MKKYLYLGLVILGIVALGAATSAAKLGDALPNLATVTNQAGTTEGDLSTVIGTVITAALSLVGIIFLILMVYSGYLWMTAAGDGDKIDKSKSIISAAIIGLVLTLSAYAISVLVTRSLSREGDANTGGNLYCCFYRDNRDTSSPLTRMTTVTSPDECSSVCAAMPGFEQCRVVATPIEQCL